MPLVWGFAGYFVLMTVLRFFHDRCVLPLLGMVVALRLGTRPVVRAKLALFGLSAFATVSILGTWEHLQYNRALWHAMTWAQRMGVPPRELDGGRRRQRVVAVLTPGACSPDTKRAVLLPWINEGATQRYAIVNGVPSGAESSTPKGTDGSSHLPAPSTLWSASQRARREASAPEGLSDRLSFGRIQPSAPWARFVGTFTYAHLSLRRSLDSRQIEDDEAIVVKNYATSRPQEVVKLLEVLQPPKGRPGKYHESGTGELQAL